MLRLRARIGDLLHSLQFKIVFWHLIVVLVPFLIVGISINSIMQSAAVARETDRLFGEIRSAERYIAEILLSSQQFNAVFLADADLLKAATTVVNTDQIRHSSQIRDIQFLYSTMSRYVSTSPHVESIYFYNFATQAFYLATREGGRWSYGEPLEITFNTRRIEVFDLPWHQAYAASQANHSWILTEPIDSDGEHLLAYYSLVQLASEDVFALISSNIRESEIRAVLQQTTDPSDSTAFLVDSAGKILSSTDPSYVGLHVGETGFSDYEGIAADFDNSRFSRMRQGEGTRALEVAYRSTDSGWYYVFVTPYGHIMQAAGQYRRIIGLLYLAVAVLSIASIVLQSRLLVAPIRQLMGGMREFSGGDFSVRVEGDRRDELGYVFSQFNSMASSVQSLVHDNLIKEIERKTAVMKLIQTQLKSHFLFNTLDLVNWNVLNGDRGRASETLVALSRFYRIALTNGQDLISVREAAELISLYAKIVELRYPGRYQTTVASDPAIRDAPVLKYIFQPLVENAFVHGLSKAGESVTASFSADEGGVRFTIRDDGRGMPPAKLLDIRDELGSSDRSNTSFALSSVDRHIKLFYGEEYGLEIESKWAEGTEVTVLIPQPGDRTRAHAGDN